MTALDIVLVALGCSLGALFAAGSWPHPSGLATIAISGVVGYAIAWWYGQR